MKKFFVLNHQWNKHIGEIR